MNQQILWNNMLFNPSEIQSMTDRLVSPRDSNNVANQDDTQLSIWGSSGSSSNQHYQQAAHDENKLENGWAPSATIRSRSGPSIEDNPFEGSRMLSFHNINSSHSATQIDGVQSFPQNSPWFSNLNQNTENAAPRAGVGNELAESRLSQHPYLLGFLDAESVSSLDLSIPGESSENVGLLREDEDRPESSIDGRRVSCKRKNSEGFPGQCSISGTASSSHQRENSLLQSHTHGHMTTLNISSSAMHRSVANSTEEYPTGFGSTIRGVASGCYPSATSMNAERSHRNYRMRTNPALPHPNSWSVNTFMQPDLWSTNQPPHSTSLNRALEPTPVHATSSQNQTHLPAVPGQPQIVYHFPWSGASTSRISSSSGSFSSEDRMIAAREASHSRNMPVSSNLDLAPATRNMTHDQAHWTRSASMVPNSHTGTNSGLHPTIGVTWLHHQAPTQYLQPLAEAFHPSLYRSSNSETGGQAPNFPLQHTGHSFISHDAAQQIRASLRGPHQTSHIRSGHLIRRRNDGLLGAPLTMRSLTAAGEERSRMLSEIRHALESLRRGDGLRFEDLFILDQTLILAGNDLHDRHRDMRLDVDNMSYEELLALEERIGDVCTGLGEETIIKCIKQRKHSLMNVGPSTHQEPCCICQEEYVEDDDLGILDCGHDFHTVCIKQWLMQKNLCPICKSTALMT